MYCFAHGGRFVRSQWIQKYLRIIFILTKKIYKNRIFIVLNVPNMPVLGVNIQKSRPLLNGQLTVNYNFVNLFLLFFQLGEEFTPFCL